MPTNFGPSYEGRSLPRPGEELVDQGLGFDVGTLMNRRRLLQAMGVAMVGVGLAVGTGVSMAAETVTTEIPEETAGPYPGDGSNGVNVLTESGIIRSDIRSSFGGSSGTAKGIPMTLNLTITDLANGGTPFAGVAVYVWHCDRDGNYSMYSTGITDQNYLRGVQIADENGLVSFTSIFPACYSGRWPHIHFEVYPSQADITDATNAIATSQVALPQAVCAAVYATAGYEKSVSNLAQVSLATDNVFGEDSGVTQLATATGDTTAGYTVSLTAAVDTTTTPGGSAAPTSGGTATTTPTTTTTTPSTTTTTTPSTTTSTAPSGSVAGGQGSAAGRQPQRTRVTTPRSGGGQTAPGSGKRR